MRSAKEAPALRATLLAVDLEQGEATVPSTGSLLLLHLLQGGGVAQLR